MANIKKDQLFMSDSDLDKVAKYAKLWETSTAKGDSATAGAAHDAAQRLRAQYGYSGGEDGSQYIPFDDYVSPYTKEIKESVEPREPFSYDPATDPLFQQYKTQYTEAGMDAMEDTLGILSAKTDGLASSYAATASQQTYNNYMDDLTNKIPELEQLAYSMYQDQGKEKQQAFDNYTDLDKTSYDRFSDQKNFDYEMAQDKEASIYNAAKLLASLKVMPDEIRQMLKI